MAGERNPWEERLRERRLVFEVAGAALTTVTWCSLCFVVSVMVIRGYWTPSPPLDAMGWQGTFLYLLFTVPFVAVAVITSAILLLALWSLILHLKWDLEASPNAWIAVPIDIFSKLWHFAFAMFLFMLIAVLSAELLDAVSAN